MNDAQLCDTTGIHAIWRERTMLQQQCLQRFRLLAVVMLGDR